MRGSDSSDRLGLTGRGPICAAKNSGRPVLACSHGEFMVDGGWWMARSVDAAGARVGDGTMTERWEVLVLLVEVFSDCTRWTPRHNFLRCVSSGG